MERTKCEIKSLEPLKCEKVLTTKLAFFEFQALWFEVKFNWDNINSSLLHPRQGRRQNLKEVGKPENRAQFILNNILIFTFTFIYLIFYKRLFLYFQQQLIFEKYRFLKYFSGILSNKHLSATCMSLYDIHCRCNKFRSLSLLSPIVLRWCF